MSKVFNKKEEASLKKAMERRTYVAVTTAKVLFIMVVITMLMRVYWIGLTELLNDPIHVAMLIVLIYALVIYVSDKFFLILSYSSSKF